MLREFSNCVFPTKENFSSKNSEEKLKWNFLFFLAVVRLNLVICRNTNNTECTPMYNWTTDFNKMLNKFCEKSQNKMGESTQNLNLPHNTFPIYFFFFLIASFNNVLFFCIISSALDRTQ